MSNTDGITDEVRKREDEYFKRKDRELIERMRKVTEAAAARKELETATGISDAEALDDFTELGFTPQALTLLTLVPVLQVAWVKGTISDAERKVIVTGARSRGVAEGSEADHLLGNWLEHRPADEVFRKGRRLIARILADPQARIHIDVDDLLKQCEAIAQASGGIFGIVGTVSAEEKAAIQEIAAELKPR